MAKQMVNNIKLGVFVMAGLLFLILLLYMIGKNKNLFGSNFILKARFENVQGLQTGNNVRYAGIESGTVKKITILNDTVVEVMMVIDDKMKSIIRKNAIVSIGTDGFVGNKVVNIIAVKQLAAAAEDGDVLQSKRPLDTDEMLRTLNRANNDIAVITHNLRETMQKINNSSALWNLLSEETLPKNIKQSALNIKLASEKANSMAADLQTVITNVKNGEGSLGILLTDTAFTYNLNEAVKKIKTVGDEADSLSQQINQVVKGIEYDVNNGRGAVNAVLKDTMIVIKLNNALDNIQKGTDGFNQNMDALKHNFLFRGYFRKLEKQKQKNF